MQQKIINFKISVISRNHTSQNIYIQTQKNNIGRKLRWQITGEYSEVGDSNNFKNCRNKNCK